MTKINIATHLNHVYTDAVRAWLDANPARWTRATTRAPAVRRSRRRSPASWGFLRAG